MVGPGTLHHPSEKSSQGHRDLRAALSPAARWSPFQGSAGGEGIRAGPTPASVARKKRSLGFTARNRTKWELKVEKSLLELKKTQHSRHVPPQAFLSGLGGWLSTFGGRWSVSLTSLDLPASAAADSDVRFTPMYEHLRRSLNDLQNRKEFNWRLWEPVS